MIKSKALSPRDLWEKFEKNKLPKKAKLFGQVVGISEKTQGVVLVTLRGGGHTVKAEIPIDIKIDDLQSIILSGYVETRRIKDSDSEVDIVLTNTLVMEQSDFEKHSIKRLDKKPFVPFLVEYGLEHLLVVGTEEALKDYKVPLEKAKVEKIWLEIKNDFSDATELLSQLNHVLTTRKPTAIVFTRQGTRDKDDLFWDNPHLIQSLLEPKIPVYSAIGEEGTYHLFDDYADESLRSPRHMGSVLKEVAEAIKAKSSVNLEGLDAAEANVVLLKAIYEKLNCENNKDKTSVKSAEDEEALEFQVHEPVEPILPSPWDAVGRFIFNFFFFSIAFILVAFNVWFWFIL